MTKVATTNTKPTAKKKSTKSLSAKPPKKPSADKFIEEGLNAVIDIDKDDLPWETDISRVAPNTPVITSVRIPVIYHNKIKWLAKQVIHKSQNQYIIDLIKEDVDRRMTELGFD